jgi:transaldolase
MPHPMKQLLDLGQSVWLDFLDRDLLRSGRLRRLVAEEGLRGLTSNPTIFQKALAEGDAYDSDLRRAGSDVDDAELLERIMVEDLTAACDELRPIYDETGGADGFASIEVSPLVAHDTDGSIREARRLWREVSRPNLMVKIPATGEGIPAIERCLAAGINVNITLLFSVPRYLDVVEAHLRALEARVSRDEAIDRIASVASFFVSRVDIEVDKELARQTKGPDARAERARALQGRIAVANAKLAYADHERILATDRWKRLAARGAQPQRLLWASTTPKNPAYGPLHYVAPLVGNATIDTMTEETIEALDHPPFGLSAGLRPDLKHVPADAPHRPRLTEEVDRARRDLADLAALGIDLMEITKKLEESGVRAFVESFEKSLRGIAAKRRATAA